jgi:hypothetical protein
MFSSSLRSLGDLGGTEVLKQSYRWASLLFLRQADNRVKLGKSDDLVL